MIITLGIILVTFSPYFEYFSGFWLFSNNGSGEKILWSDLRSHISRHVGLTLHEVDNLAEASLGEIPAINSQMTCDEAIKIEAFLISASGVDISLFQNLHQTGYLQRTNLLDSTSQQKLITFSDVPLDHPVYVAWRALLRLEIFPVDSLNRVRVHDPIRWDDWKSVIEALDNRLELNGKLQSSLNVDHRGIMCGQDVQESLVILRQVLELKEISLFSGISPDFVPNRLEAFGAISQLIEETSKQG
ncbi:hypothetical protein HYY75_04080 [bacterium]|nr:hypothetical protein [bacterium]